MPAEVPDILFEQQSDIAEEISAGQTADEEAEAENSTDDELQYDDADGEDDDDEDEDEATFEEMSVVESPDESADSRDDVAALVDNAQISLAFEVGESQISVGQLQSLMPGYTFELSTLLENPVVIKAFGQTVGRGELLQVGDRLGVRVVEITCHRT